MTTRKPPPLDFDELLAAEYDYIAQTASQAHEDRARVSSFYLIAVGSLVAALFSTQLFEPDSFTQTVKIMFGGLFILLTLLGTSTIMQLARLRAAWFESMQAMNKLKEFMVSQNKELAKAFHWTNASLPSKFKTDSVSYYQAAEVALISALMFGAAIFFLQQAFFAISLISWIISILSGALTIYTQLIIYKRALQ
ncbi:MAG TPA: hypothetical protein VJ248_07005 [Candidatus Udaeobacter sp.]|nr:hypothetical protein [Candidatus Udaeobacter sp.]